MRKRLDQVKSWNNCCQKFTFTHISYKKNKKNIQMQSSFENNFIIPEEMNGIKCHLDQV